MKKTLVFLVICLAFFSVVGLVHATDTSFKNPLASGSDFTTLLNSIIDYIKGFAAALVTLMLIIAGLIFITSGGNPGKIDTAKRIAIWAAVGAAIVLVSSSLISIVTGLISG